MKEIILIKNGELILKGLNRSNFEDILIKNMRRRLKNLGEVSIRKAQSTIYVEPMEDDIDIGFRVKVPFGIKNRPTEGFVYSLVNEEEANT